MSKGPDRLVRTIRRESYRDSNDVRHVKEETQGPIFMPSATVVCLRQRTRRTTPKMGPLVWSNYKSVTAKDLAQHPSGRPTERKYILYTSNCDGYKAVSVHIKLAP